MKTNNDLTSQLLNELVWLESRVVFIRSIAVQLLKEKNAKKKRVTIKKQKIYKNKKGRTYSNGILP